MRLRFDKHRSQAQRRRVRYPRPFSRRAAVTSRPSLLLPTPFDSANRIAYASNDIGQYKKRVNKSSQLTHWQLKRRLFPQRPVYAINGNQCKSTCHDTYVLHRGLSTCARPKPISRAAGGQQRPWPPCSLHCAQTYSDQYHATQQPKLHWQDPHVYVQRIRTPLACAHARHPAANNTSIVPPSNEFELLHACVRQRHPHSSNRHTCSLTVEPAPAHTYGSAAAECSNSMQPCA